MEEHGARNRPREPETEERGSSKQGEGAQTSRQFGSSAGSPRQKASKFEGTWRGQGQDSFFSSMASGGLLSFSHLFLVEFSRFSNLFLVEFLVQWWFNGIGVQGGKRERKGGKNRSGSTAPTYAVLDVKSNVQQRTWQFPLRNSDWVLSIFDPIKSILFPHRSEGRLGCLSLDLWIGEPVGALVKSFLSLLLS